MNFPKALTLILSIGLLGALTKYCIFLNAFKKYDNDN